MFVEVTGERMVGGGCPPSSWIGLRSENYNQAIEILEKWYGNKQPLITLCTN